MLTIINLIKFYDYTDNNILVDLSQLNIEENYNTKNKLYTKYAIMTLLMINDSYLPGILLLGSSIKKVMPKEYEKYIEVLRNKIKTLDKWRDMNIRDYIPEVAEAYGLWE